MRQKIEKLVDEIRQILKADGTDIELVNITEGGVVHIRFKGTCSDCAKNMITLRQGVEKLLREQIPEVKEVIAL